MKQLHQFIVLWCILTVTARIVFASRKGHSTETNSCNRVRGVPDSLRNNRIFPGRKLNNFYQKYIEAYGIPVLGSKRVPDEALKRACYTVRFVFADNSAIREAFYRMGGRFAIMAQTEVTKDIPEHSWLPDSWNKRARGLGGTPGSPLSTGAEENLLCYPKTRYSGEDIFLHELGHGLRQLSLDYMLDGWKNGLKKSYKNAKTTGLWKGTYAMANEDEYFAEGLQSYFNANVQITYNNGVHNTIGTREELKDYDPMLYSLIDEVFPCHNTYLLRCDSSREREQNQKLKMNCQPPGSYAFFMETADCDDDYSFCQRKALQSRHCNQQKHKAWMKRHCPLSCKFCGKAANGCKDKNQSCRWWAKIGECKKNPGYMLNKCKLSCNAC